MGNGTCANDGGKGVALGLGCVFCICCEFRLILLLFSIEKAAISVEIRSNDLMFYTGNDGFILTNDDVVIQRCDFDKIPTCTRAKMDIDDFVSWDIDHLYFYQLNARFLYCFLLEKRPFRWKFAQSFTPCSDWCSAR